MVMKRLWKRLREWIPAYAVAPLIAWFTLNLAVYAGARAINHLRGAAYHDLSLPIDRLIPQVTPFIVIYVLAYVSWFIGFLLICRQGPARCGAVFGEMCAKLLCLVIFVALPTAMEKPAVTDRGFFGWLARFIFSFDEPDTLFPSIHCLENWVVWRGMWGCKGISKPVKTAFFVFALLVFASTLLVKQHVIVDIPAAIVVGEIGLAAARRLRLGERYAAWLKGREVMA